MHDGQMRKRAQRSSVAAGMDGVGERGGKKGSGADWDFEISARRMARLDMADNAARSVAVDLGGGGTGAWQLD